MTPAASEAAPLLQRYGIGEALPDIAAYIARQRWSGAADTAVANVEIHDTALLHDVVPILLYCVVSITYEDGRTLRYSLPLGLREIDDPFAERAPDVLIGRAVSGDTVRLLYDAVGDADYVQWCWRVMRDGESVTTQRGAIQGEALIADAIPQDDRPRVRMLSVEQSNTSLVLNEEFFFKHLRRVEDGPSQELEMARALAAAKFEHAVPVLAAMEYQHPSPSPVVLLQPFLHNATEGWALALTSLRDLYAEAEENQPESTMQVHVAVDDQGGAFVAEAHRLGAVTAKLHLALSRRELGGDMRPLPVDAATLSQWADSMSADLDALLRHPSQLLDPLRDVRSALEERFDAVRELEPSGLRIRIHGDLHLGQMLRITTGWVILDFEGEPNRTPAERRERSSPLRDVAGMLRSFDYAAAVALTERARPDSDEWEATMVYGDAWANANRDAFWSGYLQTAADSPMLPSAGAVLVMRRAFEVQKAVYEVGYELGHRPAWARIPIRFLLRGIA